MEHIAQPLAPFVGGLSEIPIIAVTDFDGISIQLPETVRPMSRDAFR